MMTDNKYLFIEERFSVSRRPNRVDHEAEVGGKFNWFIILVNRVDVNGLLNLGSKLRVLREEEVI